jgi:hypothetical protein
MVSDLTRRRRGGERDASPGVDDEGRLPVRRACFEPFARGRPGVPVEASLAGARIL